MKKRDRRKADKKALRQARKDARGTAAQPPTQAAQPPQQAQQAPTPATRKGVHPHLLEILREQRARATLGKDPELKTWTLPEYAPNVLPEDAQLAMDEAGPNSDINGLYDWAAGYHGLWAEGIGFMGYPALAALTQRSEYRQPCEIIAEEMTRKWVVLKSTGDDDKSEKIRELTSEMERFRLREKFREATELDGVMGLSFISPNLGTPNDTDSMMKPLLVSKEFIRKDSLKGFIVIDPTWVAPNRYDSTNPFDPTFYKPSSWFVMGTETHQSRLLMFRSRPVPDILKPAYNFGGLSLVQMMKPYVDNWLRTRQSVSDLLNSFTIFWLKTNMQAELTGATVDGSPVDLRLALFTLLRNNRGIMALDKDTEELGNISAPLGTLDALQAQSQEQMAAPARAPLIKMFGYTPKGLGQTSDGEIRVFYDTVHGKQERDYTGPLKVCLELIQLSKYGEIDPEITAEFVPLWQLDEAGEAAVQKTKADTAAVLMEQCHAISPEDVRKQVASDPQSQFHGLEGDPPEPEEFGEGGGEPGLSDPSERIDNAAEESSSSGANAADSLANDEDGPAKKTIKIGPLTILVETPKGEVRRGRTGDWAVRMPADYGFIKGVKGIDADSADVFVGPVEQPLKVPVYVVEQHRRDGSFDEYKSFVGFADQNAVENCYDTSFVDGSGPARRVAVYVTTVEGLTDWLVAHAAGPVAEDSEEFDEGKHPRAPDGKFGSGGGSSASSEHTESKEPKKPAARSGLRETKVENGKRVQGNGDPLPAHVAKLKLPPAWTDVKYSDDPDADLLAVGKDSKGRVQSVYSEKFSETNAAAKFERIHELMQKFGYITEQNAGLQRSGNPKIKDSADCLDLIMKMGVRPGSETDTGAKVKAYGATTLEGKHVVTDDDGNVSLRFVGKKGVALDLPVSDKGLASMLTKRASTAGEDGKLFPNTNDALLRDHTHTLDGHSFKVKDFRTHLGTSTALGLIKQFPVPKSESEYKKSVMEVAKHVSKKLGNTPVIALQSYISPTVFAEWRANLQG